MVYSRAVRGAVIAVVFLLYWLRLLSAWHLLAVGVIDSVIQVLGGAAGSAVIPNLVARKRVHWANAWMQGASQVAPMIAGGVGGVIISLVGIAGIAGITSTLFVASGLSLALLADWRFGGGHGQGRRFTPRTFLSEFRQGMRFVLLSPAVRGVMLIALLANFFVAGPVFVLMPIYASDVLGGGAPTYGFLRSAMVAGTLVGLVVAGYVGERVRIGTIVGGAVLLIGAQFVLLALTAHVWSSCIFLGLVGLALSLVNVPVFSALQLGVPDATRARAMTAFMALSGASTPASFAVTGSIAELLGSTDSYLASGLALAMLSLVVWVRRDLLSRLSGGAGCA
jgi:hypothetical protein